MDVLYVPTQLFYQLIKKKKRAKYRMLCKKEKKKVNNIFEGMLIKSAIAFYAEEFYILVHINTGCPTKVIIFSKRLRRFLQIIIIN